MSQSISDASNPPIGRSRGVAPSRAMRLRTVLLRLDTTIRLWCARRRQRRALAALAERNDYLLQDIGLTQQDAFREAAKPFWRR